MQCSICFAGSDDGEEEGEEEEDEDDDLGEEEESDDEDEIAEPPQKIAKTDKGKQNGVANGKVVKEQKQPQQKVDKTEKPQKTKTLAGGVQIEDIRVGKGPDAKPGRKVTVYYEGRLKTGKVFDSSKSGEGFTFPLGKGQVIRAWDLGVAGMKVGGKRRIVCPPASAYGARGSPPVIPPNSTLTFDVELRGVK